MTYYTISDDDLLLELEDIVGSGCVTPDMLAKYRAKANKEKYAETNENAKKFARKNKLCALTGTPAQVRWAQSIRAERFQSEAFTNDQMATMAQVGNAEWWINTRGLTAAQFGQILKSAEVCKIIKSTEAKAVESKARRSTKSAQKKAEQAYKDKMAARVEFIVSLKAHFILTDKTLNLGEKVGDLTNDSGSYRVFIEKGTTDTARVLFNKEHYLVKLTEEQIATYKAF